MKDADGRTVQLGDRVKLWEAHFGTVVCALDEGGFSSEYPRANWVHLRQGALIKSDWGDLFYHDEGDEDFEVIASGGAE
jgi:hypothetical protein